MSSILFASDLKLPRDPQENLHAATKQYVDTGLDGKAAATHTHNTSQITGLGTAATCDYGSGPGNVPVLDDDGKLSNLIIPAMNIGNTFVVTSESEMLALSAQKGDVAVRSDVSKTFILTAMPPTTLANWQELLSPSGESGIPVAEKGAAGGVATLDVSTKIPIVQIPTQSVVSDSATEVPTGAAVFAHTGATTAHESTSTPTANRIAMYDADSRLKSSFPAAQNDVATKGFVESCLRSYRTTISGDGTNTSYAINHNLGTSEVSVELFQFIEEKSVHIFVQWESVTQQTVNLLFAMPPKSTDVFYVKVRA